MSAARCHLDAARTLWRSHRLAVNDAAHRALVARYAALPHHARRVSLTKHAEVCHRLADRTLFPSTEYYKFGRPLLAFTVLSPVSMPISIVLAYLVYLHGDTYTTYLEHRVLMLSDVDTTGIPPTAPPPGAEPPRL